MTDVLDRLAQTARETVQSGYYLAPAPRQAPPPGRRASFVRAIRERRGLALIAEVKPASPSGGRLLVPTRGEQTQASPQTQGRSATVERLVRLFARRGAAGLSVLIEPVHFGGSLDHLRPAVRTGLPVLFKDFLLDPLQLEAAAAGGAAAVLLILALFERGHATSSLTEMIRLAHERDLEVLLEVYDGREYRAALETEADMIGINNRDLKTLEMDLNTTRRVLHRAPNPDRPVWGLSGVRTPEDVRRLREAGVDAVLVGTALMRAKDPGRLLRELLEA